MCPGTAMTFAGLSNEKQRADVIAYLNSLVRQSAAAAEGRRRGRTGCGTCRAAQRFRAGQAAVPAEQ